MKPIKSFLVLILFLILKTGFSQETDSLLVARIYKDALTSDWSYNVLGKLCKETPHRLAGSAEAVQAVKMMYKQLLPLADTVYLQEVTTKHWVRGKKEEAAYSFGTQVANISALSLGGSVGTGKNGLKGKVVEVHGLEELKSLGRDKIAGKIVFFNQAMDPMDMNPGRQYGKTVPQRFNGAAQAAYYGAIGTVVRSMSVIPDRHPHTGIMRYSDTIPKIPAIAIGTLDANELSQSLQQHPDLEFSMHTWCESLPDNTSYNLIAEIRGTDKLAGIITVGGHIDCWDAGEGANDDGAGCAHSIEVLRILKHSGIKTKRTIRVVLFMDEEMYQVGARKYAASVKEKNEKIYAAIESDSGASLPIGFGCTSDSVSFGKFVNLKSLFEPYGLVKFRKGGGGVDVEFLEEYHVPLLSLSPEPQRYFELHHSTNDVFERISMRELQLGGAASAALVVLIDKYNLFGE